MSGIYSISPKCTSSGWFEYLTVLLYIARGLISQISLFYKTDMWCVIMHLSQYRTEDTEKMQQNGHTLFDKSNNYFFYIITTMESHLKY